MQISYNTCETEMPEINQERISLWISKVIEGFECKIGEINYYFCSDDYLLQMNREHLNHDYFTDIITFDYVTADIISGDLFISLDTVRDNAEEYKVAYFDELHRVIVHGIWSCHDLNTCNITISPCGPMKLLMISSLPFSMVLQRTHRMQIDLCVVCNQELFLIEYPSFFPQSRLAFLCC